MDSPLPQPLPRSDTSAPSMHSNVHSKSGASPNWPAAMCRQTTRQVQNFALAGPQYWPGHRSLSPLTGRAVVAYGTIPRALKAGLLHPTQQTSTSWARPRTCVYSVMLTWTASPWPLGDTRFEPANQRCSPGKIPRQAQDTVEENTTASRTTTTDTHTAAISSTPTPTQISYIGRMIF
ncbi:hypothetical protein BASA60_007999 [Batrachochytrium salamandrivorans]|nr:hypothetical protein BASA60_007999 [Batrachochytrium salamandrivorans]